MILDLCPKKDNPEFQVLNRPNGNVIELGYTVKKILCTEQDANHLIYIYKQDNKIRCVDELFASHGKNIHLKPCGDDRKPSDLNELLRALICILTCIKVRLSSGFDIDVSYDDYIHVCNDIFNI